VSVSFNPGHRLIVVTAQIWGPAADTHLQLALDTGATSTLINTARLVALGYDPALAPQRVRITTGSGVEYVPYLVIDRIEALGQHRTRFPVLSHTLPPSASVDGLLGLDFLRGRRLTIDFRAGRITLR
jgi:predicted aspartyl protease